MIDDCKLQTRVVATRNLFFFFFVFTTYLNLLYFSMTCPLLFTHKGYTVLLYTRYLHLIKLVEKMLLLLAEIQDVRKTLCLFRYLASIEAEGL